jgi:hypothetical protein
MLIEYDSVISNTIDDFADQEIFSIDLFSFDSFLKLWNSRCITTIHGILKKSHKSKIFKLMYNSAIRRLISTKKTIQSSLCNKSIKNNRLANLETTNKMFTSKILRDDEHFYLHNSAEHKPDHDLNISIGAIYSIYILYYTQPSSNYRARIYTPLSCLERLTYFVKQIIARYPYHDAIKCIQRLISDHALVPGALDITENDVNQYKQTSDKILDMLRVLGRETKTIYLINSLGTATCSHINKVPRFKLYERSIDMLFIYLEPFSFYASFTETFRSYRRDISEL